jgi:beta-galactosidase
MLGEARDNMNASATHGAWFCGRDYEYVKMFWLDKKKNNCNYTLKFEGVYRFAVVYINGEKAAEQDYGFTHFYVPLNTFLKDGANEIRVVCKNSDQPNCRWYTGAGIYRPVWLIELPDTALAIDGVKIKTLNYKTREAEILFTDKNEKVGGMVEFSVTDGANILYKGKAKTGVKTSFFVPTAELWDTENPKLYTLKIRYADDHRELSFGFRQISVSREYGFLINGARVILRGACIHSDNGLLGAAAHPFADERKIKLIKAAGYNAIRSAHNPCSETILKACDRLGVLILDEYTDGWYVRKTRYDYAPYVERNYKKDFSAMVEKDYNHPSVVMYSTGNEVSETAEDKGVQLASEMTEFLHTIDETRPVTCGVNIFFNYLSSLGFGVYSDKKAAKGSPVGSAFFNHVAGIFGDKVMKIGATLRGSDVKTRAVFEKLDIAGYNYGILRYKKDLKKYPKRIILGTETFCKDAYLFYELAKRNVGIIGDFVWAGIDYLGEVGIGSWEYADYAKTFRPLAGWISAGSGRLDLIGNPLGEMLYTRVAFGLDPVRMAVVPVAYYGKPHSPSAWKMSNARESWAWNGAEGKKTVVEVYARAEKVVLYLNGKKLGCKRIKNNCIARFKVRYAKGELKAVALKDGGQVCGETRLTSGVGEPRLVADVEKTNLKENELAYIRLRYADMQGKTYPLVRGKIQVTVQGGELVALGHACPYNEQGYLNKETDVYFGEALAIVRPKTGTDKITLFAVSDYGEATTEIKIVKKEVESEEGTIYCGVES